MPRREMGERDPRGVRAAVDCPRAPYAAQKREWECAREASSSSATSLWYMGSAHGVGGSERDTRGARYYRRERERYTRRALQ